MISETIVIIFVVIGLIFNTLGIVGILRFPDVYTRLHAETKMTTFGTIFLCLAAGVYCISNLHQHQDIIVPEPKIAGGTFHSCSILCARCNYCMGNCSSLQIFPVPFHRSRACQEPRSSDCITLWNLMSCDCQYRADSNAGSLAGRGDCRAG